MYVGFGLVQFMFHAGLQVCTSFESKFHCLQKDASLWKLLNIQQGPNYSTVVVLQFQLFQSHLLATSHYQNSFNCQSFLVTWVLIG